MKNSSSPVIYATFFQGHGCINYADRFLSGCMSKDEVKERACGAPCFDLENTSVSTLVSGTLSDAERCERLKNDPDTLHF